MAAIAETVISARDLETIGGLLAVPPAAAPRGLLPAGVLESLARLFPGGTAAVSEVDEFGTLVCSRRVPGTTGHLPTRCFRLSVTVPALHRAVRVSVERVTPSFTARDQVLFRLLVPLLQELIVELDHRRELEVLSPSELRVLALVAGGASNSEVSARLSLSVATVRKHLEHVYRKLGVCNRTAAVARAFPHGIP